MPDPDKTAHKILAENAAEYLKEVATIPRGGTIEVTLKRFKNSPLVLYAAVHYATHRGIKVLIAPEKPLAV